MVAGQRFDLETARAEARAAKKAARVKSILGNAAFALVILALAGAGWYGWTWWRDRQAAKAAEEEAARLAADRAQAERAKADAARRAALEAKREAERQAAEARRLAERARKEAESRAREEALLREVQARKEAERLAKENEDWQRVNKPLVDRAIAALTFSTFDHIGIEAGAEAYLDLSVDEKRWVDLYACAAGKQSIEFLEMLRGTTVTNDFSEAHYPDRETLNRLLDNLARERFTMIVRLRTEFLQGRRFALVAPDVQEGLALPVGARALKDANGRLAGWTAPFVYGDRNALFVMNPKTVERFNREWKERKSKYRREAKKLTNADEYVTGRLTRDLPDFIRSVRIELETPPPVAQPTQSPETKRESKIQLRGGLKGANSDIRSFRGGFQGKTLR